MALSCFQDEAQATQTASSSPCDQGAAHTPALKPDMPCPKHSAQAIGNTDCSQKVPGSFLPSGPHTCGSLCLEFPTQARCHLFREVSPISRAVSHSSVCWPSSHYFSPYFVIIYLLWYHLPSCKLQWMFLWPNTKKAHSKHSKHLCWMNKWMCKLMNDDSYAFSQKLQIHQERYDYSHPISLRLCFHSPRLI